MVIVIGAGVIGLTTAVVLAEAGSQVRVWTREPSAETTSAVAGGLWWPYRVEPEERVGGWALASLAVYRELAAGDPDGARTGVRLVEGLQAGARLDQLGPWAGQVPGLREDSDGLRGRLPLIDMPRHLAYLRARLAAAGGVVEDGREVTGFAEAAAEAPVVVNCTGLGARTLVPDPGMRPVRGQLVIVENPGIEEWLVAASHRSPLPVYLLPQPYGLVLGGTAEEDAWSLTPSPATARAIVARCAERYPEVGSARVLAHRVGLRPGRAGGVRLAAERLAGCWCTTTGMVGRGSRWRGGVRGKWRGGCGWGDTGWWVRAGAPAAGFTPPRPFPK